MSTKVHPRTALRRTGMASALSAAGADGLVDLAAYVAQLETPVTVPDVVVLASGTF